MVPSDFLTYFTTMAGVEATLFGLIFIVISIAPESITAADAPVERQVRAASSYSALLNPLVISLCALVPHQQIGIVVLVMSSIGLINTLLMGMSLLQNPSGWVNRIRNGLFILAGLIIYGFEIYYAILLQRSPADSSSLYDLATLLVVIYIFGIARAWDLIGIRQFHIEDWLSSLNATKKKESSAITNSSNSVTNGKKD